VKPIYLLIIVLFLSSFSKSLVKIDNNTCKKNKNEFSIEKALQTILNSTVKDSTELACLHHQIALYYYNNYNNLLSLKYNKEALKIRKKINDGFLWKTHNNIALIYDELEEYSKAIQYHQQAYNLPGIKASKDSTRILRFLSLEYAKIGDFEQALKYGKLAIKTNTSDINQSKAHHSIGLILTETKDTINLKLALQYLNKAIQLVKYHEYFDQIATPYYINLGVAYNMLNEEEKALKNYYMALDLVASEDTLYRSIILNNVGYVLTKHKKYNLALEKIFEALSLKQTYFNEDSYHFRYAFNYENIAECHFEMKNYEKALQNYQTAIINLTNSFRSSDVFQNPVLSDSLYVYSNLDLIRVLDLKAKTALTFYQQNNDEAYLQLAHQTYQTLLDFHNQLQKDIATENSRLFQAKNMLPYIESALKVIYQLQDKGESIAESAFRLMEKNKATVLLQSINESQALQFANIPDTLIEREGELKTSISFYKKQLNNAKIYDDTENIDHFEKLLFKEENKHRRLIENLERNYPNYHQLKYRQNEIELSDMQDYLNEGTALLEYFVGDSSIYVLSIQKEKSKLYKTTKPKNWNDLINNFRQSVTDINLIQNSGKKAFDLFTKSATELHTILLQKPMADAESNIKQINYVNLNYLLNDCTLSYAYSVALLLESNHSQKNESDSLALYAGFAPVYEPGKVTFTKTLTQKNNNIVLRNRELVDLPNARINVQQIADFVNGQAFLANEATKQQFINKAKQFKIVHLATHGFLNDDNPLYSNLMFTHTSDSTDNLLYAADLYNIELNADLVVLSACNTGTGKLQKGEGVMSLSRAFTYAGSVSLWEVPDKSTATIMQFFFQYLKKGYTKDEALKTAKLDFIQEYPTRAHPLFWAGFVPSGNMAIINIEEEGNYQWFWVFIIVAIFISGGIVISRSFRQNKKYRT